MEKIIEWKNQVKESFSNKFLKKIKKNFLKEIFACLSFGMITFIVGLYCHNNINSYHSLLVQFFLFIFSLFSFLIGSGLLIISLIFSFCSLFPDKLKRDIKNYFNQDNISFDKIEGKFGMFLNDLSSENLNIELETINDLINLLSQKDKEEFENYLLKLNAEELQDYNKIMIFVNYIIDKYEHTNEKVNVSEKIKKMFNFKNEDLKELEANSSNFNIRNIL